MNTCSLLTLFWVLAKPQGMGWVMPALLELTFQVGRHAGDGRKRLFPPPQGTASSLRVGATSEEPKKNQTIEKSLKSPTVQIAFLVKSASSDG